MNVEWDEELIADREHHFHLCGDQACQADQQAVRIARAQHAEVARLTAEREEYERTRWTVVAQRNGALNDLETANAELSRLRAVIEEARKALSLNGSFYTPRAVVISMLKL